MVRQLRRIVCLLSAMVMVLAGIGRVGPLPDVRATENLNKDWQIELWPERRWTPAGGTLVYHASVLRLGAAIGGARLTDVRDATHTQSYGAVAPPPTSGGGASASLTWDLPSMGPGDRWSARYEVQASASIAVGERIANYILVEYPTSPSVRRSSEVLVAEAGPPGSSHLSADSQTMVRDSPWNTTSAANPNQLPTNDPVAAGTGEHFVPFPPDIDPGGPLQFVFQRYYASGLRAEGWVTSTLGANWMHNYDVRLVERDWGEIIVVYEGGKLIAFQRVWSDLGGGWALNFHQEQIPYQLRQDEAGHYWLTDPSQGRLYRFDPLGELQEIVDRNGNRLTIWHSLQMGWITHIEDNLGRRLALTYTPEGRLARVAHGARHVDFTYDVHGNLATSADALGQTITYTYAADLSRGPLLTAMTLPRGNTPYRQAYNAHGQVITQQDAYGNVTTLAYDTPSVGRTLVSAPDGSTRVFAHVDRRLGAALRDTLGNTVTLTFDDRERLTVQRDRLDSTASVSYDDMARRVSTFTNALGQVVSYTYVAQTQSFANPIAPAESVTFTFYNLARVMYPDGTREQRGFDAHGNVLTYTNRANETTLYQYNARGQVTRITNPAGGVTEYTYSPDGTIAATRDSDTGSMAYGYDTYRRISSVTWPDGTVLLLAYDLNDRLRTFTDQRGTVTTLTYDANGHPVSVVGPLGQAVTFTHDLMDRLVGRTDPLGQSESYTYDALGNLSSATDRAGNRSTYVYNAEGWLTAVTDASGQTWRTSFNREGFPIAMTTPLGHTTTMQPNALGRLVAVADPLGASTRLTYVYPGRVASVTDRLGRVTRYAYDPDGRLSQASAVSGGTASYARNSLGLPTSLTDLDGQVWGLSYSSIGRLLTRTDPLGRQQSYAYDALGRLRQLAYPDGWPSTAVSGTLDIAYDAASHVRQISASDGLRLSYTYDDAGRLLTTEGLTLSYDARGNVTNSQDGAAAFRATYDNGARLRTLTYDNQATITYTYDMRNLLTRVEDSRTRAWIAFAYDHDHRLTQVRRSNAVDSAYSYDAAGRVTRIQDGLLADQQYTLNAEGEPVAASYALPIEPTLTPQATDWTYDAAGQISLPGYVYDARGRQTAAPGASRTYDGANRLTSITSGSSTVTLGYNGLGDLHTRSVAGATTTYYRHYALSLAPLVAEQSGGQYRRFYVYTPGGSLLYSFEPVDGTVRFYHYDRLGSTLFLTDGAGAVRDAYLYDPYGALLGHSGASDQPFTYVGRYGVRWESVGGLYDMRARYYDPASATFLSRDPLWPALREPRMLNPYQYAYQNPLLYLDPQGLMPDIGGGFYGPQSVTPAGGVQCHGQAGCSARLDLDWELEPDASPGAQNSSVPVEFFRQPDPLYVASTGGGYMPLQSHSDPWALSGAAAYYAPQANTLGAIATTMVNTPVGLVGATGEVVIHDQSVVLSQGVATGPFQTSLAAGNNQFTFASLFSMSGPGDTFAFAGGTANPVQGSVSAAGRVALPYATNLSASLYANLLEGAGGTNTSFQIAGQSFAVNTVLQNGELDISIVLPFGTTGK